MTRSCLALLGVILGVALVGSLPAASPPRATALHCQVLLLHEVDVPARATGLLQELYVREGDVIAAAEPLGQLDDRASVLERQAAALERDAARARAQDDIEVRYSVKSFELAEVELNQSLEINRRSPGAVPASEIRRLQLARHRAALQIDRSELDLRVSVMAADVQDAKVQASEDQILRHRIEAPFEGIVVEIFRQASEWVNVGEPVLRMVRLDELTVDGFLSGAEWDIAEISEAPVKVEVELARGRKEQFQGQIAFVNPMIQAGNKFRIRAVVQNRQQLGQWLLRPGMAATMQIDRK